MLFSIYFNFRNRGKEVEHPQELDMSEGISLLDIKEGLSFLRTMPMFSGCISNAKEEHADSLGSFLLAYHESRESSRDMKIALARKSMVGITKWDSDQRQRSFVRTLQSIAAALPSPFRVLLQSSVDGFSGSLQKTVDKAPKSFRKGITNVARRLNQTALDAEQEIKFVPSTYATLDNCHLLWSVDEYWPSLRENVCVFHGY